MTNWRSITQACLQTYQDICQNFLTGIFGNNVTEAELAQCDQPLLIYAQKAANVETESANGQNAMFAYIDSFYNGYSDNGVGQQSKPGLLKTGAVLAENAYIKAGQEGALAAANAVSAFPYIAAGPCQNIQNPINFSWEGQTMALNATSCVDLAYTLQNEFVQNCTVPNYVSFSYNAASAASLNPNIALAAVAYYGLKYGYELAQAGLEALLDLSHGAQSLLWQKTNFTKQQSLPEFTMNNDLPEIRKHKISVS